MHTTEVQNRIAWFNDRKAKEHPELYKPVDELIREWS